MIGSDLPKEFSNKYLRYRITLEDPETIQKALDIKDGDVVLSITSAGCNILNFLMYNPRKIISVDVNKNQNYLLELKISSIKHLNHTEFLEILGVKPSSKRKKLYETIRESLGNEARLFWDSNLDLIEKGITHSGQFNIKKMGKILRFLIGTKKIEKFFEITKLEKQKIYFYKKINILPVRILYAIIYYKLLFNVLKKFNFSYKNIPNKDYLLFLLNPYKRFEHIVTHVPIKNNYFLSTSLLGFYLNDNTLPAYLQKDVFNILKKRVDRIEIKTARIEEILEQLPPNYVSKFNLSTTPDFIKNKDRKYFFEQVCRVAKNNAKFCYFSTKINRNPSLKLKDIIFENDFARKLFKNDRSMLYLDFQVGKISKI